MRLRLLVIAVFVSASAVPGVLAYSTGLLRGATSFAGGTKTASLEFRVTSLGWPDDPLGLAAGPASVAWEQRTLDGATSGIWAYDVSTQRPARLLPPSSVGRDAQELALSRDFVTWVAKDGTTGDLAVRAYDMEARRLFAPADGGLYPQAARDEIVWITRRSGPTGDRGLAGVNTVTDVPFELQTRRRVRQLAARGHWVAWTAGPSSSATVWATDRRRATRYKLAASGFGVALGPKRVAWVSRSAGETKIMAWNLSGRASKVVYTVRETPVSSLSLGTDIAVWVQGTGSGSDIWAYDFNRRRAYAVTSAAGEQTCPVVVGRTVFWADKRSGQWELYGRALQP